MHNAIIRCQDCGRGLETKSVDYFGERLRLVVCECTPWKGEPAHLINRYVRAAINLEQRE